MRRNNVESVVERFLAGVVLNELVGATDIESLFDGNRLCSEIICHPYRILFASTEYYQTIRITMKTWLVRFSAAMAYNLEQLLQHNLFNGNSFCSKFEQFLNGSQFTNAIACNIEQSLIARVQCFSLSMGISCVHWREMNIYIIVVDVII